VSADLPGQFAPALSAQPGRRSELIGAPLPEYERRMSCARFGKEFRVPALFVRYSM
jgi:hypothetical protein